MPGTARITGEIELRVQGHPQLLVEVRSENTFLNPEYLAKARMGKRLWGTPKKLSAWREDGGAIILPRGFGNRLNVLSRKHRCVLQWEDGRVRAPVAFPAFLLGDITFRDYQEQAVSRSVQTTQGLIIAPTGAGKTFMALELIRRRGQRALILVHTSELARQWRAVVKARLGIEAGIIGGGVWKPGAEITVAMLQTMQSRPDEVIALARTIGLVLVDECHHIPARTFSEVIRLFPAYCRYGVTATPTRRDGLGTMIERLLGDVLAEVKPEVVLDAGGIVNAQIQVVTTGMAFAEVEPEEDGWAGFVSALAASPGRNRLVAEIAVSISKERPTLVLTDRVEQAATLASLIPGAILAHGGLPADQRKRAFAAIPGAQVTVGTKGLLGEGIDIAAWSCLVMASPLSGTTPLLQAIGRVIRPAPGKRLGVVIDLVDDHPFSRGAWKKRQRVYGERKWAMVAYQAPLPALAVQPPAPTKSHGEAVLSLDLGGKTGWALCQSDSTITSGTLEFKPGRFEGGGMAFVRFKRWLEEVRASAPLDAIFFEEVRAHAGTLAAQVYGGFLSHLTAFAESHQIPYQGVPVGTIKRHATGKGNAGKEAVMTAMTAKGHHPGDDNEADALALLHWALDEVTGP